MIRIKVFWPHTIALATILLGACTPNSLEEPAAIPIKPTASSTFAASPTGTQAVERSATATATVIPSPNINVYNIYIGKDEARQSALLLNPMVGIVEMAELDSFAGSYAAIFLQGKSVTGMAIAGGEEMLEQLIRMLDEARQAGFVNHTIYSSYRSYEDQVFLINKGASDYLEETGQFLAPAGRSEHQLGTAVDVGWGSMLLRPDVTFNNEAANAYYQWLKKNAHIYGFVISYPFKSNEENTMSNLFEPWITEYKAETWHLRYVGVEMAAEIYNFQDEQGRNYLDPYSKIIPQNFYLP